AALAEAASSAGDAAPDATTETQALAAPRPTGAPTAARASASLGGAAPADWAPAQAPILSQVEEIKQSASPPPTAGVRVRGNAAGPRYRRSTGSVMPQFQVPRLAIFAALAIALVGLLLYWQLPSSVAENREERFAELLASARESNARAQATSDPGLRRQLLTDARAKLADAENIREDDPAVASLQADVSAALAVLDAVFEVPDLATVVELAQTVSGDLSALNAVVGGDDAYFLDAEGHRVLRAPLDGSGPPEEVLGEGDLAGFATVGVPAHIAWLPETDSLAIIDDQRNAFAYFPGRGSLPLVVRDVQGLGSVSSITSSAGNLYVLDVEGDQVWRYLPGQGGFDSERTALLDGADLADATEIAVGQDVYVLDQAAGVRRFVGKAEAPFPLAGIDRPLLSPVSISVLPGSNRIVVADRGNKRIVVATADGVFLRQIVSPQFTDLRAVSVDEGNGLMYVLNGDTLLRGTFPP
ncbi:MAG TPA: hypothetical protein VNM91_08685, partial [Dehalococcoidia bacterium]|nr:hypothetical protein [Dehalococcoidia bacterium]